MKTPPTSAPDLDRVQRDKWIRRAEILAAVALGIALLVMIFNWNWFKGPIERRVSAATGREFRIHGDLDVDLSMKPLISADGISLANTAGAADRQMATVRAMSLRIDLWQLFRGRVVLPEVNLDEPHLLLEVDKAGKGNWVFDDNGTPMDMPLIRRMVVDRGQMQYRNPYTRSDLALAVRSGEPSRDARVAPLLIDGKGHKQGQPYSVNGRIESPLVLEDAAKPYHIDLDFRAGATRAIAKGALRGALELRGYDLDFTLSGPDMSLLYPLIGLAVPPTPPYKLRGRLGHEGRTWSYRRFSGKVGDSDLAGDASVDTGGARPFLRADLISKRLDLDDLGGFVGLSPQAGGKETTTPAQANQAAVQSARSHVLPDIPFNVTRLRAMDADVRLRAKQINAPSLPLEAMDAHLFVDAGVVRLDPLKFNAAGGELDGRIRMDARQDIIATTGKVSIRGLQLPKLFPDAKLTEDSTGRISGVIDLQGRGNSLADMLAGSDGQVGLVMGTGRISNLLLEYAGLDIAEALKFLIGKDRTVPIRCAYADFAVADGVMTAQQLALDTTDTAILGEGKINLGDETLDLRLKPRPKDHSFLSLRSPLLIGGTFKDPSFRPDARALTLRGGAALALGALAPPAALLALFERGPGKDLNCGGPAPPTKAT